MADVEYEPSREGMRELMGSPTALEACRERAARTCDRANSMVSPDSMSNNDFIWSARLDGKGMARASVYTGNPHGYNACLSNNVLLKALG